MKGSCLCGQVQFDVAGLLIGGWGCSCTYCRKFSGTAFSFTLAALEKNFEWKSGQDLVSRFEKFPGTGPRCFCSVCGAPVPCDPLGGFVEFHIGSLDEEPEVSLELCYHELPAWAAAIDVIPWVNRDGLGEFQAKLWRRIETAYMKALDAGDKPYLDDVSELARLVRQVPDFDEWWQRFGPGFAEPLRALLNRE